MTIQERTDKYCQQFQRGVISALEFSLLCFESCPFEIAINCVRKMNAWENSDYVQQFVDDDSDDDHFVGNI